jgi:hypothetical protein
MKREASWYVLTVLKTLLWITLVWCLLVIATDNSNRIRIAQMEATEDVLGPSRAETEYRHVRRLADAINPLAGVPFAALFAGGFLAVLHSLDLVRYRLDAILTATRSSPDATAAALRRAAKSKAEEP